MTAFFVTGSGTEVGKTTASCALLRAARSRGLATRGIKPIESGCSIRDGTLYAPDATALGRAAGHPPDILFQYEPPLAPSAAATLQQTPTPALASVLEHVEKRRSETGDNGLVLVEGAGGLLVPLSDTQLISDLAAVLALPILVVARDGLGTINHTALTLEVAAHRNLRVAGFMFSSIDQVSPKRAHANAEAITAITGARYLGRLPRLRDDSPHVADPILDELIASIH